MGSLVGQENVTARIELGLTCLFTRVGVREVGFFFGVFRDGGVAVFLFVGDGRTELFMRWAGRGGSILLVNIVSSDIGR